MASAPRLAYSSIENGQIEEYDEDGQVVSIIGKQPDGTHGVVVVSGPVPPRPAPAQVSVGPGLLNYAWNGLFANAATGEPDETIPTPLDFARVEVHASRTPGFTAITADTLVGTIESPRGSSNSIVAEEGTWYVVLVARALSGKASMQSLPAVAEVQGGPDVDALREDFERETAQLQQDLNSNALALQQADGRIEGLRDRLVPVESGLNATTASVEQLQNAFPSIEQGLATLQNDTLPAMQSSINGKNKTVNSTSNASGTTGFTTGDTWQKWSSLGTGGKLLAAWRFTTKWEPVILDPTYLPQVDIGSGTFGSLDGARLKSGSVATKNLLVGSFDNLLENPSFEYDWLGWEHYTSVSKTLWNIMPTGGRIQPKAMRFTGSTTRAFGPTTTPVELTSTAKTQEGNNTGAKYRVGGWVRTTATAPGHQGEICLYTYAPDGTFLGNRNFNITGATSEWKYFSTIMEAPSTGASSVSVRINATVPNASDEYWFDDISLTPAVDGSVIVNGSVTANEVNAASVGAAVGAFVEADIGKLTVTGATNLRTVVAERIAANVGSYLKLYASQVFVGHPGNMMPDPGFNDAGMTALRNQHSTTAVDLSSDNDLRLNNTSAGLQYLRPYGTPQTPAGVLGGGWIAVEPGQVWTLKFTVSAWKGTTGWAQFVGRTKDGSAFANPYPSGGPKSRVSITTPDQVVEVEATIPENCYWIIPEVAVAPGGYSYIKRNTFVMSQKITPSLIVDGFFQGLRVIGSSVETTAAADRGIKLNDGGLNAWDNAGNNTFRLDSATGAVYARGNFETAASDIVARLGVTTYPGSTRVLPSLMFQTGTGDSYSPKVFAEGNTPNTPYSPGSMVVSSSEATTNSTGRGELELAGRGAHVKLRTIFGPNSGTGFEAYGASGEALVLGMLPASHTARQQMRIGYGSRATIPKQGYLEWTVTQAAPPPVGVPRPWIQLEHRNNLGASLSPAINSVTRTGFKMRVYNPQSTDEILEYWFYICFWTPVLGV